MSNCFFPYKLYELLIGIVDKSLTGTIEWTKGRFDINEWTEGRFDVNEWTKGRFDINEWTEGRFDVKEWTKGDLAAEDLVFGYSEGLHSDVEKDSFLVTHRTCEDRRDVISIRRLAIGVKNVLNLVEKRRSRGENAKQLPNHSMDVSGSFLVTHRTCGDRRDLEDLFFRNSIFLTVLLSAMKRVLQRLFEEPKLDSESEWHASSPRVWGAKNAKQLPNYCVDVMSRLLVKNTTYGDRRDAVEAAKTAAKSIADMQNVVKEDLESLKEDDMERSAVQGESEDENDKRRKAALDKLEKASEGTILGQACHKYENLNKLFLIVLWRILLQGMAGIRKCVKRGLENSAVNIAESIQQGGYTVSWFYCPILTREWKSFYCRGNASIEVDKKGAQAQDDEDQLFEEVTFDRCFYIYGGPELCDSIRKRKENRDWSLEAKGSADEMKNLHDSSVKKAAEMAAGSSLGLGLDFPWLTYKYMNERER
ncbi:hypothetical protein HYC85_010988 [Camellia sinensis]|uniref:Uncharacterized protein n=1 Tax=Camellia sinensis TaxID=4442 RepID=A0A7J7HM30_CAMSI|nr:hypothetical protein HYC85_010988 [Camellia sinensis]